MKLGIPILATIIILTGILFSFRPVQAADKLDLDFFYSKTCPHCVAEKSFLGEITEKYPEISFNYYLINDSEYNSLLNKLVKKHNAEKYMGIVPMTFIGEDLFIGFDSVEKTGKQIEESIQAQLKGQTTEDIDASLISLPFVGEINTSKYSLPILAIILGILDGFNICSLGALILILGIVIALRSRKKTLVFGGLFIVTTAVVYGFLIILWHQLFSLLAPYQWLMTLIIALISLGGGAYFFKEFIKFRKQGPTCETVDSGLVSKLSLKIRDILRKPGSFLAMTGGILLFAALITIIEFPCSAAVPVVFAGILAKAQLSPILYFFYIGLFILFYMLDEIVIFLIALFTMKLWLSSPKFVTWITLIEAIILFLLGIFYLQGLF